jgi:hypothetical protein
MLAVAGFSTRVTIDRILYQKSIPGTFCRIYQGVDFLSGTKLGMTLPRNEVEKFYNL